MWIVTVLAHTCLVTTAEGMDQYVTMERGMSMPTYDIPVLSKLFRLA